MGLLATFNTRPSRWGICIAATCLLGLIAVVISFVLSRHVLNNVPSWPVQIALLLVMIVSMFGTSAGTREAGHNRMFVLMPKFPDACRKYLAGYLGHLLGMAAYILITPLLFLLLAM